MLSPLIKLLPTCALFERPSGDSDTDFASVSSLLHMDTDFSDIIGHSWTLVDSPVVDGSIKKFGAGSGHFFPTAPYGGGGVAARITAADHASLRMGTVDFCIEGWFRPQAPQISTGVWFKKGENTAGGISCAISPTSVLFRCLNTTDTVAAYAFSATEFTHVAFVRASDVITIYIAGVAVVSEARVFDHNDTSVVTIGCSASDTRFGYTGHIDDMRITKGIPRYTVDFTPPAAPFPNS